MQASTRRKALLTPRQVEVMQHMANGETFKSAAKWRAMVMSAPPVAEGV